MSFFKFRADRDRMGRPIGKTRIRLAEIIKELLGENFTVDPEDLHVNRSGSKYDDTCSWEGLVTDTTKHNGNSSYGKHCILSYFTMKQLVKAGKVQWGNGGLRDGELLPVMPDMTSKPEDTDTET